MQHLVARARTEAAALRRVAGQFRARAESVAAVDRRMTNQLATLTFEGPAATQFRRTMDAEHQRLGKLSATLDQLAGVLDRLAVQIEADPMGSYSAGGFLR